MASVDLHNVTKRFGSRIVVNSLSLQVGQGELMVLLGVPGAGKTTTLRLIAGLERPDSGEILFDGQSVARIPPQERDVAMVFEDIALYPHMTGFQNIAYPLRLRKLPPEEVDRRVRNVARLLDIEHLLDRRPHTFSGGERQRVAFARAIVRKPSVLLLDEPLSNLDAKVREAMRAEVVRLQQTIQQTTVMATHDYEEAMAIGTRIAVMHEGRLLQVGSPDEIYDRPATTIVATLTGSPSMNLIPCIIEGGLAKSEGFAVPVNAPEGRAWLGIRPEEVEVGGTLPTRIELVQTLGRKKIAEVALGTSRLKVVLPTGFSAARGQELPVRFPAERIRVYSMETGQLVS